MHETKRERYIRILSGMGGADISAEACKELVELLKEQPTIEERKTTIEFPHVFIAEGYDSIKSEDGETGFGVYDPENKQIFIAGAVPDEIFVKALLHELMHWVQDISGCAFNEGEANTFAENIYNTMESYIVTNRWIPCSERLPEEKDAGILKKLGTEKRSEYVLATVEVKGERMTVTACTYDGVWHWDKKYAFPDYKVVAWMPLPAPWKEGEEG